MDSAESKRKVRGGYQGSEAKGPVRVPSSAGASARRSYFEHYVGSATVALILQTKASDLPAALDIVKRVRELGYYMREAGSRDVSV